MKRLTVLLIAVAVAVGAAITLVMHSTPTARDQRPVALVQLPEGPPAGPSPAVEPVEPVAPVAASCDADLLLEAVKAAGPAPERMVWSSVDVAACRNGYARVFAITGGTPPPGTQLEGSEQVFLRDVDGTWQVFASGSGLDCVGEPLGPDIEAACEALGLH